jgi:uncharacterized protein YqeY
MLLIDRIRAEHVAARKERDMVKSQLLGTVIGEISKVEKAPGAKPLTDEDVIKVVRKFVESAKEVVAVVKDDTAPAVAVAKTEITILESYLPQMMTEAELTTAIDALKAGGAANMGAIMSGLKAQYGGRYDGKLASDLAKKALA